MKKGLRKNSFGAVALSALLIGGLASCKGTASQESKEDSVKEIDQMVEAVETAPAFPDADKYNAAFFTQATNASETPSDSTYIESSTGLKYVIVNQGEGRKPGATDEVTVHYTGTLTDGTIFDSSVSRGEPTTFPLNRVIPGWTEGLQYMSEGGTAVFYIPSDLAYGEAGAPPTIPPSAPLIFWVQLLNVK